MKQFVLILTLTLVLLSTTTTLAQYNTYSIEAQQYVFVGVPAQLTGGAQDPVTLFGDDLGGNAGEDWRISRWSVTDNAYQRYGEDGYNDPPNIEPGYGYYIISAHQSTLDINDEFDYSLDGSVMVLLEVPTNGHRGVNMLANPFYGNYDWRTNKIFNINNQQHYTMTEAVAANIVIGYARTYDKESGTFPVIEYAADAQAGYNIAPWEGIWVEIIDDGASYYNYFVYGGQAPGAPEEPYDPGRRDIEEDDWSLSLHVSTADGSCSDPYNRIGIKPDCEDGYDARDAFEFAPINSRFVHLYFPYEGDEVLARSFTYDYRSPNFEEDKVWDLVVRSAELDGEELVLSWPNIYEVDYHYFPVLEDMEGDVLADFWDDEEYHFDAVEEAHFRIRVHHDPTAVEEDHIDLTPTEFGITSTYPNPFNDRVTIDYRLPYNELVTITATDLQGREVAKLYQGRRPVGTHQVSWNAHGQPSGLYLIQLEYNKTISTEKVLLLK